MANKIKAICFDYYMTLVKLKQPFEQIKIWVTEYLKNIYPSIDADKFYSRFTKNRAFFSSQPEFQLGIDLLSKSMGRTCQYFQIPYFKDEFVCFAEKLFISPEAYADSHLVLNELKKHYHVGLLTNADNYILQSSISNNQFSFDFIITSDDARCNKPKKLIFQYALSFLGIEASELFMIGDSQVDDIYGAGQLGINTIWINRDGALLKEGIIPPNYQVDRLANIIEILVNRGT